MPIGDGWRYLPDVSQQHHALVAQGSHLIPRQADGEVSGTAAATTAALRNANLANTVGIWEWDASTRRVTCDETFRRIVGLRHETEVTLSRILERAHPDDRELALRGARQGFPREGLELRVVRPDGELRQVVVRSTAIRQGHDDRVAGVFIDMTDANRARERVIDTLESMTDGYIALNRSWQITYINSRGAHVVTRHRAELVGQDFREAFPGAGGADFQMYRQAMERGEAVTFEQFYEPLQGWFEVRAYPMSDGIGIYFRDVTARHETEAELERLLAAEQDARKAAETAQHALAYQASHDSLTGLLNRGELMNELERYLAGSDRVSVMFIDLDRFKLVNDALGHAVGDRMLEVLAQRLRELGEPGRAISRLGGDEFVIGMADAGFEQAVALADRVLGLLRKPVEIDDHALYTTASIGLSAATPEGDATTMLRNADVALYRAKAEGGDGWSWFDEDARRELLQKVEIERGLHKALAEGQFTLHYQPAFDLLTGEPTNTEALLRWEHPEEGKIPPDRFIPVAEECGLIGAIGEWVIRTSMREASAWLGEGDHAIWLNVSVRQLARPGLAATIERELNRSGLAAERVGIEVTEWAFADRSVVVRELERISALGVRIAIDDFGTGFSSISRLSGLPVDVLKIDQDFMQKICLPGGLATVTAIVDLGHALDCVVIAEGVETAGQLAALRETGCDQACGFLLARPVPTEEVEGAIEAGRRANFQTAAERPPPRR